MKSRMHLVACYDVDTTTPEGERRLRKVAKACEAFGTRVQKSVFEVSVTPVDYEKMLKRVLGIISREQDTFRVYFLKAEFADCVKVYGLAHGTDFEAPLIV
ncbi:MAG: CRISPR-associated endonuclease Cas2 [Fimbriimonadaceae bacterium]|nr:MAG: CRISPR-associated endonuclease Cas2 [Fimbriimonadaceae bacterium]